MAQPDAGGAVADPALPDGIVAAQFVVVVHSDQHLDFLCVETEEASKAVPLNVSLNVALKSDVQGLDVWSCKLSDLSFK